MLEAYFLLGWVVCLIAVLDWLGKEPPSRTSTKCKGRSGATSRPASKSSSERKSTSTTVTRPTRVLSDTERREAAKAMRDAIRPALASKSHRDREP